MTPTGVTKTCLVTAIAIVACGMGGPCTQTPGPICTQQAVESIVLNLRDPDGNVVAAADAVFTVNGGSLGAAHCTGDCDRFTLIFEQTGRFDISVRSVGLVPRALSITVPSDAAGCHPVTQTSDVFFQRDTTIGVLSGGVWQAVNGAGQATILRFGVNGEPIGAMLTKHVNTGDTNLYIAYNNSRIRGVIGQPIIRATAPMPTRTNDIFDWSTTSAGWPAGFTDATMSPDLTTLTGTQLGDTIVYTRLSDSPAPLQAP